MAGLDAGEGARFVWRDSGRTPCRSGNLIVLALARSNGFRKDVKRARKKGKDIRSLREALTLPSRRADLIERIRDRAVQRDWSGRRDLHIEPDDWLLASRITADGVQLLRTGTRGPVPDVKPTDSAPKFMGSLGRKNCTWARSPGICVFLP